MSKLRLERPLKEPRLLNICFMKCSISWIITIEAAVCLLFIASSTYYLIKWNSANGGGNQELPALAILAIVAIVAFFVGLIVSAVLGRSLIQRKAALLIPYLIWKGLIIILIVPAVIWLALALTILPDYCGGVNPRFPVGDSRCLALTLETSLLSLYFIFSIIFFIYASLVVSYFKQSAAQKKAQSRAVAIQRKLSHGVRTLQRPAMITNGNMGVYGTIARAPMAYPPVYGTLRPPPAPQYRQYSSNQLAIGYYYT